MSSNKIRACMALVAAAQMSACASVGPDFVAPRPPAPQSFPGADIADAQVTMSDTWWRSFGAAELDALVAEALSASPTIDEADAALDAARAARDSAYGGLFPQSEGSLGAERARINATAFGFGGFPTIEISRYTAGLGVSYDLDLFGGGRRTREAATARLQAERFRYDAARLTLAADITAATLEAAVLRAEIETLEQIVADDRQTLELVEAALRAGAVGTIDRIRAQTQLSQDAAELPRLRSRLIAAQTQIEILVGRTPGVAPLAITPLQDFVAPAIPRSVPSQVLHNRPDIRAAEASLHAATADIGVRVANLYPQVRLSADYAQTALDPEVLFEYAAAGWSVGPRISLPLFSGGARRADVRRAEAEAMRADARYRATVLRAFGQVIDAYADVAATQTERELREEGAALAGESLRLARRAYEAGAGTLPEVIDAQRQANLARRAQARARGAHLLAIARLCTALGAPIES